MTPVHLRYLDEDYDFSEAVAMTSEERQREIDKILSEMSSPVLRSVAKNDLRLMKKESEEMKATLGHPDRPECPGNTREEG